MKIRHLIWNVKKSVQDTEMDLQCMENNNMYLGLQGFDWSAWRRQNTWKTYTQLKYNIKMAFKEILWVGQ